MLLDGSSNYMGRYHDWYHLFDLKTDVSYREISIKDDTRHDPAVYYGAIYAFRDPTDFFVCLHSTVGG